MTIPSVVIRKIEPGEEKHVCNLVKGVFYEFVAPLYEEDGVEEFIRYIDPDRMTHRIINNHFVLIAEKDGILLGAIEIRDHKHISLLFVVGYAQRQGIAKRLLDEALEISRSRINLTEMSVNSSPNAVEAYCNLGFEVYGQEQIKNGIRFIPMKLGIRTNDDS